MSVTYSFCDGATYSAADVNRITSRLVTGGIADPFTDGVPYNMSDLNLAGMLVHTEGVVPETDTSLQVVAEEDGTVTILPGMAFFPDGAVIEVDAGGYSLTPVAGVKNYVYLKNDLVGTNSCYPTVSTEEPGENTVPLCEISETGEIADKRIYARGKLPGYASNTFYTMKIEDTVQVGQYGKAETKTYTLGNHTYRFLLAVQEGNVEEHRRYNYCIGLWDMVTGKIISCDFADGGNANLSVDYLTVFRQKEHRGYTVPTVTVGEQGQVLSLPMQYSGFGVPDVDSFPITLYLF